MKKVMKSLAIIALAAMSLVGCKKQEFQAPVAAKYYEVNFTAGMPQSKTQIFGNEIIWESADIAKNKLDFVEYINGKLNQAGYNTAALVDETGKASFTANIKAVEEEIASAIYSAVYPASAFKYNDYDGKKVKIELSSNQTATQLSFDSAADLLVAKPIDNGTEQLTSGNHELNFRRINAFAKMTVKNIDIAEDETIKSVSFQANGKELAGIAHIDLSTISEPEWNDTSDEVVVNLSDHNPDAQTFDVWFSCIPATLESGTNYTITVRTNLKTYTKNGTIGATALEFAAGDVMQFGANFSEVEGVDNPLTKTTDVLTYSNLNLSGSYSSFTSNNFESGAVYAGLAQKNADNEIQLRTKNSNEGIVTTQSGGFARKVEIVWGSGTTDNRVLNIYGSNEPYTVGAGKDASILYGENKGTLLGSLTYSKSGVSDTILEIDESYQYIGICSNEGALYLPSISIYWESKFVAAPKISATNITGVPAIGIEDAEHTYSVKNLEDIDDAICDGTIVTNVLCMDGEILYTVSPNYTTETRSGSITLQAAGAEDKVITVTQEAAVFETDIEDIVKGITLGSDESASASFTITSTYPYTISHNSEGNLFMGDDAPEMHNPAGDSIEIMALEENTGEERLLGNIDIYCELLDITINIPVKQAAAGAVETVKKFVKVSSEQADWSGTYLIVYENGASSVAFNGSLTSLDAVGNYVSVTISDGVIAFTPELNNSTFVITSNSGSYSICSASGKYIGRTVNSNGLNSADAYSADYANTISYNSSSVDIAGTGNCKLQYYASSGSERFRYYKSTQKAIQLYKLVEE